MNARDFMEMNKQRAERVVRENQNKPRSQNFLMSKAILAFISAYEMEVGYDNDNRKARGYWENVPLIEEFDYCAVHESGEEGEVDDIEKKWILGIKHLVGGWDKNEIVELRIRRKSSR